MSAYIQSIIRHKIKTDDKCKVRHHNSILYSCTIPVLIAAATGKEDW